MKFMVIGIKKYFHHLSRIHIITKVKEVLERRSISRLFLHCKQGHERVVLHLEQVRANGGVEPSGGGGRVRQLAEDDEVVLHHWLVGNDILHTLHTSLQGRVRVTE